MSIKQLAIEHGAKYVIEMPCEYYKFTPEQLEAFAKAMQQQSESAIIVHQVASPLYTAMVKSLADLPEGTKLFTKPPNTVSIDRAEYEAMKADAERYRWLRRGQTQEARVVFGKYPDGINIHDANNHLMNSALDQAIDQARKI